RKSVPARAFHLSDTCFKLLFRCRNRALKPSAACPELSTIPRRDTSTLWSCTSGSTARRDGEYQCCSHGAQRRPKTQEVTMTNSDKLLVVTCVSDDDGKLTSLKKSCAENQLPLTILGNPCTWICNAVKVRLMNDYLQ